MKHISPSTKLQIAIKGWATTKDITEYFQCSRSKAIRIKNKIKELYFKENEKETPYQNAIPTTYLLDYDRTSINDLRSMVEAEKQLKGVKNEDYQSKDYQISQS